MVREGETGGWTESERIVGKIWKNLRRYKPLRDTMETCTREEGGIVRTDVRPRNQDKVPGGESYARGKRSGGSKEFAKQSGFCLRGDTDGRTGDGIGGREEGEGEGAGGIVQVGDFGVEEGNCAAARQR